MPVLYNKLPPNAPDDLVIHSHLRSTSKYGVVHHGEMPRPHMYYGTNPQKRAKYLREKREYIAWCEKNGIEFEDWDSPEYQERERARALGLYYRDPNKPKKQPPVRSNAMALVVPKKTLTPAQAFYAQVKVPRSTTKNLFSMLPAEIRNEIYGYVYADGAYVEFMPANADHVIPKEKNIAPSASGKRKTHLRCKNLVGKHKPPPVDKVRWATSFNALHLISKLIHTETLAFMYSNTTFYFQSPGRLTNFIAHASKDGLKFVTTLHLAIKSYGNPQYIDDNIWKTRHDTAWLGATTRAADTLPGLERLRLALDVRETPLLLQLDQPWLAPALALSPSLNAHLAGKPSAYVDASSRQLRLSDIHVSIRTRFNDPVSAAREEAAMQAEMARVEKEEWYNWTHGGQRDAMRAALAAFRSEGVEFRGVLGLFANAVRRFMAGFERESALERYYEALGPKGEYRDVRAPWITRRDMGFVARKRW